MPKEYWPVALPRTQLSLTATNVHRTLLNTVSNLGSQWSNTFILKAVGMIEGCQGQQAEGVVCVKRMNGYYPAAISTISLGVGWYFLMRGRVKWMRDLPAKAWRTGGEEGVGLGSPKQLVGIVITAVLFVFGSVALA